MLSNPFTKKDEKISASEVYSVIAKTYHGTLRDYDAKVSHVNDQYQIIIDLLTEIKESKK